METSNIQSAKGRIRLGGHPTPNIQWLCSRALGPIIGCWLFTALGATLAQNLTAPPTPAVVGSERVDGVLMQIVRDIPQAQRSNLTAALRTSLRARAKALRVEVREDDKVFVEIIGPPRGRLDRDLNLAAFAARGIEVGQPVDPAFTRGKAQVHVPLSRTDERAEAWLPLAAIEHLEGLLPKGWRVRAVHPLERDQAAVAGEGPTRINSNTYTAGGANGAGLTIAVIDGNFAGLTQARTNGDAPAATQINLASGAFESGTSTHGTDCVQNVFDHAPGAVFRIYRIGTSTDYTAVITDCLANNVNIISHSLSQYNEGWGDDTGITCQQATRAAQAGILFFTSCGNRANSHYEGAFVDADGDGFHEFAPGDETIDVLIGVDALGNNIGGSHYLSWSNAASDFDLLLYDNANPRNLVANGATAGAGMFETFPYTIPGAQTTFHLSVRRRDGPTASTIEIFSHNSATWNEYAVAAGSNTAPSNATHPGVIAVGAVTQASYGSAAGSNVIAGYSSRGPSNGGMSLPDLCGPTDTLVFPQPAPPNPANRFGGTSCATPNAAGAAAAFWSADLNLNADGILWLLSNQAGLFRDWGSAGFDGIYGSGGVRVVDFRAGTRWLARNYPGTLDDGTVPFHTVEGAHLRVPNGGRLLIFGANFGTFSEPVQLGHIGKGFTVDVVPLTAPALLGD